MCSTRIENVNQKATETTNEETFNEKSENEDMVETQLNDSNLTSYEKWMMNKMKVAKEKENKKVFDYMVLYLSSCYIETKF